MSSVIEFAWNDFKFCVQVIFKPIEYQTNIWAKTILSPTWQKRFQIRWLKNSVQAHSTLDAFYSADFRFKFEINK